MTVTPQKCPHCSAPIERAEPATRKQFAALKFECGGEYVAFAAGEIKDCKTGRWSKRRAA